MFSTDILEIIYQLFIQISKSIITSKHYILIKTINRQNAQAE